MNRSIGFHQLGNPMAASPAQNQDPSPRSGPELERREYLFTQFSQATAEGEQALAVQGQYRSIEGFVHYRTTSW
jgi:hypothetical protein